MKASAPSPEQDNVLCARLVEINDMRHTVARLTKLIGWAVFEREWAGLFPSRKGRPAMPLRLVAKLYCLQHAFRLSVKPALARWAEKTCWPLFSGETLLLHHLQIDASSMTRSRKRIGKQDVGRLIAASQRLGTRHGGFRYRTVAG